MKRLLWFAPLVILVVTALGLGSVAARTNLPLRLLLAVLDTPAGDDPDPRLVSIQPGDSTADIAQKLAAAGVIKNPEAFRLLARLSGVEARLVAGDYELRSTMRPSEILARLAGGQSVRIRVTVPEGWRLREIGAALEERGLGAWPDLLTAARGPYPYPFLTDRPPGATVEGFLFPDTYFFPPSTTPRQALTLMLENFDRKVLQAGLPASPHGLSLYQVVVLASIVEREARVPDERPLIAGVFLNRLRLGMPLQADPTVQYALAPDDVRLPVVGLWRRDLSRADLGIDSPYNTYRRPGLPPTPICNPGLAAIQAVLQPAVTDYLYFVARPDGSHAFARTLEEHNQNVRRYQVQASPGEPR